MVFLGQVGSVAVLAGAAAASLGAAFSLWQWSSSRPNVLCGDIHTRTKSRRLSAIPRSCGGPCLAVVPNFLSLGECRKLIDIAKQCQLCRITVTKNGNDDLLVDDEFTSSRCTISTDKSEEVLNVCQRIVKHLGFDPLPPERYGLRLQRYLPGERVGLHTDQYLPWTEHLPLITALVYLTTNSDGGQTDFPNATETGLDGGNQEKGVSIAPVAGDLLLFTTPAWPRGRFRWLWGVFPWLEIASPRSLHQSTPLGAGQEKWVASLFLLGPQGESSLCVCHCGERPTELARQRRHALEQETAWWQNLPY
jgi:hypothetical protein